MSNCGSRNISRCPDQPVTTPAITVREALLNTAALIAGADREEARVQAEWLVAQVLGIRRLDWPLKAHQPLGAAECQQLKEWAGRVAEGEPLQYVLGEAWFMGRPFQVDRRVLIPRPETEELVERALADERLAMDRAADVIDVGTGSGCIAITLACERPRARVTAVDLSGDALDVARRNARLLLKGNAEVRFVESDLLEDVGPGSADLVISNPPYIATAVIQTLDRNVRDYEPHMALDGGADGLSLIAKLLDQAFSVLRPGGKVLLEIGDEQAGAAGTLAGKAGFTAVQTHRDLSGNMRMLEGLRP